MGFNVLLTRAMPERHTRENLAARLKRCVSEFDLDEKVQTNAHNMECAGNLCEDWTDLGCFGMLQDAGSSLATLFHVI